MLWFYVSALAVLVGAELNSEIEHASPYGKDPGEKAVGEKKALAAGRARAAADAAARSRPRCGPIGRRHGLAMPTVTATVRSDWILSGWSRTAC